MSILGGVRGGRAYFFVFGAAVERAFEKQNGRTYCKQ